MCVGENICVFVVGGVYVEYCFVLIEMCIFFFVWISGIEVVFFFEIYMIVWLNVYDCVGLMFGESFFVYGGLSGIGIVVI